MERNRVLDIGRFWAAVLVVFLHAPFPGIGGKMIQCFSRISVPFFFLVSGYFSSNNSKKIKSKIVRTFKMLLVYGCVYFAFNTLLALMRGELKAYLISVFSPFWLIEMFLLNGGTLLGHLWFLLALINCYAIHLLVLKDSVSAAVSARIAIVLLFGHFALLGGGDYITSGQSECICAEFSIHWPPILFVGKMVYDSFQYAKA